MKNLCIYHNNCADGFGAALAVKLFFDGRNEQCEFVGAQHGDEPPAVAGKHVLIVDFSYPRETIIRLHGQAQSLQVIDHHKTAQEALEGLPFCHFDMSKSGAVLTWLFLFPDIQVPALLNYIQDRDLWQWALPNSKEVSAGLQSTPMEFNEWIKYVDDKNIENLIDKGRIILDYQTLQVKRVIKQGFPLVNIAGYQVPCINISTLTSEVGNELSKGHAFAAMYFETTDKRVYCLRSASDGIDVSAIAQKFGGGGHFHAAGFSVEKPLIDLAL